MENNLRFIVTIFGGTGHYGRCIIKKLIDKGVAVKVLSRNKENARKLLGEKVEIIEGDIINKEDVAKALEGASSIVVSLSAMSWGQIKKIMEIEVGGLKTIIDTAESMGIKRMVFMSVFDIRKNFIEEQKTQKLADTKLISEKMIKASDMNWTILGCPPSYELFFRLLRKNSINVPGGGFKKLVCISSDDVGEIAAQAVLRDDLGQRRFRLAGPEIIDFPSFARRVAEITGKSVKHRTIPMGLVNVVTFLLSVINPFPRYIYKALKMMNNFPAEISSQSENDHKILADTFNYNPTTLNDEIKRRFNK